MPVSISGTNGVTFPDSSLQTAAASPFGLKNRIINGDMVIDQRNAGASIASGYPVDRFTVDVSQTSKLTAQQNQGSVTPPAGFTNYLGITSSSAYSVISSDFFLISQRIEGFNIADLNWGTANAQTVTLSFWVRSSLTGTFGGSLRNNDDSRSYVFSYTISAANTWEQKTITIAGDTTGTWNRTTGRGVNLSIGIGTGSSLCTTAGSWVSGSFLNVTGATSVVGTNGATFYITGVQLERNTTATPFEWIPYTTELQLCQRYYYKLGGSSINEFVATGLAFNSTRFFTSTYLKTSMRASPTSVEYSSLRIQNIGAAYTVTAVVLSGNQGKEIGATEMNVASGLTTNGYYYADTSSTSGYLAFNAEL